MVVLFLGTAAAKNNYSHISRVKSLPAGRNEPDNYDGTQFLFSKPLNMLT
jgi:hypothetical protein